MSISRPFSAWIGLPQPTQNPQPLQTNVQGHPKSSFCNGKKARRRILICQKLLYEASQLCQLCVNIGCEYTNIELIVY